MSKGDSQATGATKEWLLLAVACAGVFLITLDNTVLYTALPRLVADLGATQSQQLWIINAYPVVICGLLLGTGTLGDKIGHRRMYTIGLVIFGIASVIAAWAASPTVLIAARALLAIGGATMMPSTLSVIRLGFQDPRRLNLAISLWAGVATVSSALGPIVGGLLLAYFWWGSVFLLNVPIVILALLTLPFVAPKERTDRKKHWDLISSIYATITLVAAVIAIKTASQVGPLTGPRLVTIIAAILISIGAGLVFGRRQRMLPQPLITLDIFRYPGFQAGVIAAAISLFAIVGVEYIAAQKLQLMHGFTPLNAGLLISLVAIGSLISSVIAGMKVSDWGIRVFIVSGLAFGALGTALIGLGTARWNAPFGSLWVVAVGLFILGFALGYVMACASIAMMASVPRERAGMAASLEEVSYEFGALLSVAILGSGVAYVYSDSVRDALSGDSTALPGGLTRLSAPQTAEMTASLNDAVALAKTQPAHAAGIRELAFASYQHATVAMMVGTTVVLALAAVYTAWLLRRDRFVPDETSAAH